MHDLIIIKGAREHNLKSVNLEIPKNKLTVITGVSGSGKSSLAFDTIYAEGQRRYVESLSSYARQFLEVHNKPDVHSIEGLSPAIAIDQKTTSKNPRSTVATATEIYDYLRLLFARIGIPYSPATNKPVKKQSLLEMTELVMAIPGSTIISILAPVARGQKGEYKKELQHCQRSGYKKVRVNGTYSDFGNIVQIDKNKRNNIEVVVDTLNVDEKERLLESIANALSIGKGIIYIHRNPSNDSSDEDFLILSEKFSCPVSNFSLPEIEPRIFSFNSPFGACKTCNGIGKQMIFDRTLIIPNDSLSLQENTVAPWQQKACFANSTQKFYKSVTLALSQHYQFDLNTPFSELTEKVQNILLYGDTEPISYSYVDGYRTQQVNKPFEGIIPMLEERLSKTESGSVIEEMARYQKKIDCLECGGFRVNKNSLCVKINNLHIGQVCRMSISNTLIWVQNLDKYLTKTQTEISRLTLKEICKRLQFLINVGLGYLTLDRTSTTLSGGESQRIRLASQIGSSLTGVLYILDEPSVGLHQSDNDKLISSLKSLRDLGNTIIVVEHDEETILQADHVIDIGKYAGVNGGNVIAQGSPAEVSACQDSLTGLYMSGKLSIPIPKKRRPLNKDRSIKICGVRTNNLQNIDVAIPIGNFITITGVSGSGKSSLALQTFYGTVMRKIHHSKISAGVYSSISGLDLIDKIIEIDQQPIGRTPRSNPATYTGVFSAIRDLFASLKESKDRRYLPGRFSFNVKGGRCEVCEGGGMIKIEMHFLPDVYVTCDECKGMRYNKETLQIKYRQKNISDVLNMTVDESIQFFNNIPLICDRLLALQNVGLGYISVGQSATTLSGGEAQRVKLAKELSKKSTGRTLYILDEPTTGLHSHDIKNLLQVLHKLVDKGNTVLVIEHNLDVVKTSDYVIDIGPGSGVNGGRVVVEGTPEDIARCSKSITGQYLKKKLFL